MLQRMIIVLAIMLIAASPAAAHGGGGGGGHGGGHTTYTTVYIPGGGDPGVPNARPAIANIHSVAIISAIGQTMTLGRAGWLAKHKVITIADWKIDELVDATLRRYLAGRFTFVNVPHDSAALQAIPNGTTDVSVKAMHDYLAALPAQDADAFIVVRPDGEGAAPTPGLSLDNDGSSTSRPSLNANYEIDIVDAKTWKVIAHAPRA